jgi:PAS domain S-box-containing protein
MIDFFEFSNEMLCIANDRGYFTRVNQAWTKALGWSADELTSRPYIDFVHPDDLEATIREAYMLLHDRHETIRFENRYRCRNGSYRWLAWQAILAPGASQLVASARDVTEEKLQAEALRDSEERFRLLALQAPVGIYLADAAGHCTFVNQHWCEIAGADPEDVLGSEWKRFIHPDDIQRLMEAWATSVRNNQQFSLEHRYRRKTGEIRWVDGSAVALRNLRGELIGHVGTVMDITARKEAAEALLREQELLRQSIEFQERERRMIAYDIHDGIVQYAAGALMFLEAYKGKREGSPDADEIEPAVNALRNAIADGRRVMNGIRPPFLDDAGVVAAIEHLAGEKRTEVMDIEVVTDQDFGRLRPELESTLYRIAQEGLVNAVKHSHSPKVQISLRRSDKSVLLAIEDWGVGFDRRRESGGVHGLNGIRERARLAGGHCNIHSSRNEGTCISVELPLVESIRRAAQQSD